jgi:hypothetical protein
MGARKITNLIGDLALLRAEWGDAEVRLDSPDVVIGEPYVDAIDGELVVLIPVIPAG